jgi:hypothetical protein
VLNEISSDVDGLLATYLSVLTWDLDIVEPRKVELDQVTPLNIKRLCTGSRIQCLFVRIPPPLETPDILSQLRKVFHEVPLDRGLLYQRNPVYGGLTLSSPCRLFANLAKLSFVTGLNSPSSAPPLVLPNCCTPCQSRP